jgi:drug/metabolite transporter (DMT)-like permease
MKTATNTSTARPGNNQMTGILFILAGALGFSAKAVLVKLAFFADVNLDVITLMAMRMAMALPFFIVIALLANGRARNQPETKLAANIIAPVIILGLLGYYIASYLDFSGLMLIPSGLERAILFTYPTLVVILSALIYKTRISIRTGLALAITYGGILLAFSSYAALGSAGNYGNLVTGSLLIFCAAIAFAIFTLGSAHMIGKMGSIQFTAWSMLVACVATLVHFFVTNEFANINFSQQVLLIAGFLALFSTVIPSFFIAAGVKRIGASRASIVNSTGPIITLILGYFLLGEPLAFNQFTGIGLVILGAALVSRK